MPDDVRFGEGSRAESATGRLSLWAGLLMVALMVLLVRVASDIVGLVVLGATLSYLLLPLVNRLERRGMSRTAGTALVLTGLVGGMVLLAWLAAPTVVRQLGQLQERWASGELLALVAEAERALADALPFVKAGQLGLVQAVRDAVEPGGQPLIGYVPDVLETIGNAIVVPFVVYGLLLDGPVLRRRLLAGVPNRYFEFAMNVLFKADAHLGGYLRGQALIAVLVGASTALGLGLLGVDYYLLLGAVTGLANFVPYVGFVISAALSLAVSVVTTGGLHQAALVAGLFLVLQTVENVVFQPWITGKNVSMHPAVVLVAILVGGRVAGALGMALAVPAAAILKVFVVETATSLRRYHL